MRKLTKKEAKKLIGKEVRCQKRFSSMVSKGIVLDVQGQNIQIDFYGMHDWLWLPDIFIEELETTQDAP
jgi:hypothetical protein